MRIFEPHVHMYARVTADYEAMAQAGIEVVVEPAFWLGEERTHSGAFVDYFAHLVGYETKRAASYGIDHYVSLAMNPRESNNEALAKEVLRELPRFLDHPRVVAVGEIGYDSITELETWSMVEQIRLARERDLPLQIHSPHMEKERGVRGILQVVEREGFPMERTLVDHSVEETTPHILVRGAWAGHSVYPMTKLSPERAANLVEEHGIERMMVHSAADWGPSDPLMVAHTVKELFRRGLEEAKIEGLVWENPRRFFSQSGRLK